MLYLLCSAQVLDLLALPVKLEAVRACCKLVNRKLANRVPARPVKLVNRVPVKLEALRACCKLVNRVPARTCFALHRYSIYLL